MAEDQDQNAQAQADANQSFARSGTITTENGSDFQVRNPLFFNAKQLRAYTELHHRMNQCDKWPDRNIPEQRRIIEQKDGTKIETYTGAFVQVGDYIEPYQETNAEGITKLVEPPYEIQVAQIVLGDKYQEFEDAGGSPSELVQLLKDLRNGVAKRADADDKSVGSTGVLAAVPAPDSV
ncbi:hypothetical protein [Mycolicibacterium canariasense]|uniref:hypothetical protein n=1 Tax=Mycolicibacterium canariasense TaxID=228230 RepID=UPI000A14D62B|nr:hypothetical protein [Mycolicibacterium canariasense]MCV7208415.1 hypothetical protein [Mycolicibacterium canariasense]ORV13593.1 hypothetical protein AWB94_05085 [Mycolicibacterium canariasense]